MAGNPRLAGLAPMHPGELLREVTLPALGMAKKDVAEALGMSRAMLYAILGERSPITPAMALRLAKFFGNSPEFWMNLQAMHDLTKTKVESGKQIERDVNPRAA